MTRPVRLAPNPVQHFYRGGGRIAALRGFSPVSDHQPEEWVAATVSRFGHAGAGLALTEDGTALRDLVAADPEGWLGPWPAATPRVSASDTGLLLKLLDAGQRLPVHVHPDRDFAVRHLDCPYGKTEAWFVIEADADAAVHLGWREDVDPVELGRRRDVQDSEWMLSRMNRVPVRPGDGILVPAGQVHAIGEGVFLAEAQEPTDYSIVLEWSVTTSDREDSHLGVGFPVAMKAVSHRALPPAELAALCRRVEPGTTAPVPQRCLPEAADPFFRMHVLAPDAGQDGGTAGPVPAGFAALVVLDGEGTVRSDRDTIAVCEGDLIAVPAGFGPWSVEGPVRLVAARPGAAWPADLRFSPGG